MVSTHSLVTEPVMGPAMPTEAQTFQRETENASLNVSTAKEVSPVQRQRLESDIHPEHLSLRSSPTRSKAPAETHLDSGYYSRSSSVPPSRLLNPEGDVVSSPNEPPGSGTGRTRRGSAPTHFRPDQAEPQHVQQLVDALQLKLASLPKPESAPSTRSALSSTSGHDVSGQEPTLLSADHLQHVETPAPVRLPRTRADELDLIIPNPFPSIDIAPRVEDEESEIDLEKGVGSNEVVHRATVDQVAVADRDRQTGDEVSPWRRVREWYFATYAPRQAPPIVLPSAPTDVEKTIYLNSSRVIMYLVGVFAYFSLTAGLWLFTITSAYFAWFGVFVMLLQLYLGITFVLIIVGKDFDTAKHQKILEEHPVNATTCPTVDIYLPCCKEPLEVLENTYGYVSKLDYPADKLKVYVLDDGAMEEVAALARRFGFEYVVRDDRPRFKKAGNLRWAFQRTQGDFFGVFDADFCARPDFLREIVPWLLADPKIAILQTPQFFRTSKEQTWIEQGAGAVQEFFYRMVQISRDKWGGAICVGTNAIYRRSALEEVGGPAEIGMSEDVHTGFGCVDRGWTVRYIPVCLACGVCPDTPQAFFSQQMRWAMGSTTLLLNREFWRSKLTFMQKVCYLCGMLYYSASALAIIFNPMPGVLLLWVRPQFFKYYNLAFAVPSLVLALITFRLWAKASYGLNVQFIAVIQSYAHLTAIKDRFVGKALVWQPSGDSKAHKNTKYRDARIFAWVWQTAWQAALISGLVYQIQRGMAPYQCVPLVILDVYNLFLLHRFLCYRG